MKIYNGTAHEVSIIGNAEPAPAIRKLVVPEGIEPKVLARIPAMGMLNAKIESVETDPIGSVPVFSKKVVGCDNAPEGYDVYIVSALYVSAARAVGLATDRLYTVADPVYSPDGRTILGCRGICLAF